MSCGHHQRPTLVTPYRPPLARRREHVCYPLAAMPELKYPDQQESEDREHLCPLRRGIVDVGSIAIDEERHPIQDIARIVHRDRLWYVVLNSGPALRVSYCPRCGTSLV